MNALVAASIAVALVALVPASARAERIPPGQEALAAAMLGKDAPLPDGCTWLGATVELSRVVSRYRCPATPAELVLTLRAPADSTGTVAGRTSKFALATEPAGGFPSTLLTELKARIRAKEQHWLWDVSELPGGHPARAALIRDAPWTPMAKALLPLIALGTAVSLVVFLVARPRAHRSPAGRETPSVSALAGLLLAVALVATGMALGRFRLVFDDYRFLVLAGTDPWGWDPMSRFVTVSCFFRAATAMGGVAPFLVANALAFALAVLLWSRALRRAGLNQDEATLAGAWFALAPGAPELLSRASGIENLAAVAWILGVLLIVGGVDEAPHSSRAERIGRASLVVALSAAGVLVKYPFMACLPPAIWLWARRSTVFRHPAFVVGVAAVVATVSVLLLWRPGQGALAVPTFGVGKLGQNLHLAGKALRPLVNGFLAAGVVLGGYRLVRVVATRGTAWSDRRLRFRDEVMLIGRSARCAVSDRVGPLPFGVSALLLGAVFVAPPLFNTSYWGAYYVLLAAAPLTALAARIVVRVGEPKRAPLLVQLLAVVVAVPWAGLRPPHPDAASERAPGWLRELSTVVAARPEPPRLVITAACSSPEETRRSTEDLHQLYLAAGERYGVWWETGWRSAEVVLGDAPAPAGELRVNYCKGRVMRIAE